MDAQLNHNARSSIYASFIGRQAELAELTRVLDLVIQYETPQTITLVGNQGVGKTRLINHWLEQIKQENYPPLRVLTSRAMANNPAYALFNELLEQRFKLKEVENPAESFRQQVEEVLLDRRLAEVLHFLGSFVGISVRENPFIRTLEEMPQQHDQIARAVLRRFFEMDAQRGPLLLVLEDLHLADEDSLSLFVELAEGLEGAPVLLLGTCRPELLIRQPDFAVLKGEHVRLDLPLMSRELSKELFRELLVRVENIPQELVEMAVEMTGGNPFFLEELVRVLLDNGIISIEGLTWTINEQKLEAIELPMSVEEAVRARIAVLSPTERDVLEKASTLGSVFWLEALVCFSRLQQEIEEKSDIWMADVLQQTIYEVLEALIERDYLLRMPDSSIPGATEYVFKHNMEREAIEKMASPERMKKYHLFAAQWLETKVPDRSEAQLEYLGLHYQQGENLRRAAFCFIRAGDKARARYANDQSATFYRQGLSLLDLDDALSKIEALHNLGDVCSVLGRHEEALEHFSEMLRYAWLLDHKAKGGAAHRRIGRLQITLGDHERALQHLNMALRLFERADDSRGAAATLDDVGHLARLKGEAQKALEFHRQALSLKREIGDARAIAVSLNNIGMVHQGSGSFKPALECFIEALDIRKEVGDRIGVVDSLRNLGSAYRAQSDYTKAFELWFDALRLAREIGDRLDEAYLLIDLGEAQIQLGKLQEAEEQLRSAVELAKDLGDKKLKAQSLRILSEIKLSLGDLEGAELEAQQSLTISEKFGLKTEEGAALRALAEVAAGKEMDESKKKQATELYSRAITLFMQLGHELELARAYSSFADFHDRCGEWQKADHFRGRADQIINRLKEARSSIS